MKHARRILIIAAMLMSAITALAQLQRRGSLGQAVSSGQVSVSGIRGTGASSGGAIKISVAKGPKAGPGPVSVTVSPGTMLNSLSGSVQNMVVAGVLGRSAGGNGYYPSREIVVNSRTPVEYVLEAYCAEFEKENPSDSNGFELIETDATLACILSQGSNLSMQAKQAAVWIYTDQMTYERMNEKFDISRSDWAAAQGIIGRCQLRGAGVRPQGSYELTNRSPLADLQPYRPQRSLPELTINGLGHIKPPSINKITLYPGATITIVNQTSFTLRGRLDSLRFSVPPRSERELAMIILGENMFERILPYTVSAGGQTVSGKRLVEMGDYTWTFKRSDVKNRGRHFLHGQLIRDDSQDAIVIENR